jgi:hypothetical protein
MNSCLIVGSCHVVGGAACSSPVCHRLTVTDTCLSASLMIRTRGPSHGSTEPRQTCLSHHRHAHAGVRIPTDRDITNERTSEVVHRNPTWLIFLVTPRSHQQTDAVHRRAVPSSWACAACIHDTALHFVAHEPLLALLLLHRQAHLKASAWHRAPP